MISEGQGIRKTYSEGSVQGISFFDGPVLGAIWALCPMLLRTITAPGLETAPWSSACVVSGHEWAVLLFCVDYLMPR